MTKLAVYISRIFEPFSVSLISLLLIMLRLNLSSIEKLFWFSIAVILGGLPPLIVLVYEKKTGKIKDWFISNRLERRDVHLAWTFGSGLFTLFAYFFSAPRLLIALSLTLLLISLVITLMTYYWKVSVHMVGVTLFVLILLLTYSSNFIWFAVLIPVVAWARIRLGAHTLTQAAVGSFLTLIITYLVFNLFGLATF